MIAPAQPQLIADEAEPLFVANTILKQLGGERFLRASGSYELLGCAGGTKPQPNPWLRMQLDKRAHEGRQRLLISLMPNDLYRLDFYTPRLVNATLEVKDDWVHYTHAYAEHLRDLFASVTGLSAGRSRWARRAE